MLPGFHTTLCIFVFLLSIDAAMGILSANPYLNTLSRMKSGDPNSAGAFSSSSSGLDTLHSWIDPRGTSLSILACFVVSAVPILACLVVATVPFSGVQEQLFLCLFWRVSLSRLLPSSLVPSSFLPASCCFTCLCFVTSLGSFRFVFFVSVTLLGSASWLGTLLWNFMFSTLRLLLPTSSSLSPSLSVFNSLSSSPSLYDVCLLFGCRLLLQSRGGVRAAASPSVRPTSTASRRCPKVGNAVAKKEKIIYYILHVTYYILPIDCP